MRTLLAILVLAGCGDETVTAYAERTEYSLQTLNGMETTAALTLEVGTPGLVAGAGPCNRYSAAQTAPYPWFELGPIATTKRACPELAVEAEYLAALSRMTVAEAVGTTLILTNDAGEEMVFQSP